MKNNLILYNAVSIEHGKAVTTSLKIAEVFEKEHKNVIQAIESLQVPDSFGKLNFQPTERLWINNLGKEVKSKAYTITRDGFTILAMGFTGAKAMEFKLAYIEAYNAMEAKLHGNEQPWLPVQEASVRTLEFRMKYKGIPVIPTEGLVRELGIEKEQFYRLLHSHKGLDRGFDYFRVNGVTDRLATRIRRAGYSVNPDAVSVNLFSESGVKKVCRLIQNSKIKRDESKVLPYVETVPVPARAAAPVPSGNKLLDDLFQRLKPGVNAGNYQTKEPEDPFIEFKKLDSVRFCELLIKHGYDPAPILSELVLLWKGYCQNQLEGSVLFNYILLPLPEAARKIKELALKKMEATAGGGLFGNLKGEICNA